MIQKEDVIKIVGEIFQTMLSMEMEPVPTSKPLPMNGEILSGFIHITGDWNGSVLLSFPRSFAQRSSETMFGMGPGEAGESEVRDAVGELTNMVGGNCKSLMPGSCQLSLPSVIQGHDFKMTNPGSEMLYDLYLKNQDEILNVRLFQGII